jgi:hypothetical protein
LLAVRLHQEAHALECEADAITRRSRLDPFDADEWAVVILPESE